MKILTLGFISSEEIGSESGSESEETRRKVFISRPLAWRSPEANSIMESLDRKVTRRRIERAKEMCRVRQTGLPSSRTSPGYGLETSAWAIAETSN